LLVFLFEEIELSRFQSDCFAHHEYSHTLLSYFEQIKQRLKKRIKGLIDVVISIGNDLLIDIKYERTSVLLYDATKLSLNQRKSDKKIIILHAEKKD
jgi:hypothetical protein